MQSPAFTCRKQPLKKSHLPITKIIQQVYFYDTKYKSYGKQNYQFKDQHKLMV
ncbi:hypothetical protein ATK78_2917 [Pedobacter metabolipauper]|uniref:Uncharacterized protein n=1 Tax=Pedobacter metabolipauper TaxID=425513 RepID=A0A4V3D0Z6_9SPHI|nr:hypothetical protein ATK78_2917 [Pedobacter metabolipauper]